jgi:hypothetical protein
MYRTRDTLTVISFGGILFGRYIKLSKDNQPPKQIQDISS